MSKKKFNVIIMHGKAADYKKVKKHVASLGYTPIVLKDTNSNDYLLENVRNTVWKKAHCAIIIMSPDDMTNQKQFRARQNVVFELGYCLGAFDSIKKKYWYHAVIILKEQSVETFSDIHGVQFIEYSRSIKNSELLILTGTLAKTFEKASQYYEEL